jgi:hypothetical protein
MKLIRPPGVVRPWSERNPTPCAVCGLVLRSMVQYHPLEHCEMFQRGEMPPDLGDVKPPEPGKRGPHTRCP